MWDFFFARRIDDLEVAQKTRISSSIIPFGTSERFGGNIRHILYNYVVLIALDRNLYDYISMAVSLG